MTNEEFISTIVPYAQQGQKDYGVYASVTIAQACWESGYGRYQGDVVQVDNNLFGIKYAGNHAPHLNITQGSKVGDGVGYYCRYESIGDSCIDHGYFLRNNSRYEEHGVFDAKNGKDQLKCIMDAGYAESAYYDGACKIIDQYNLYQYDNGETPIPPIKPSEDKYVGKVWHINSNYYYGMEDSLFGLKFSTNRKYFFCYSRLGNKCTIQGGELKVNTRHIVITDKDDEGNDIIIDEYDEDFFIFVVDNRKINVHKRHLIPIKEKIEELEKIPTGGSGSNNGGSSNDSNVEKAVKWAIDIANDDSHGYSQPNRWSGVDYDCSSFVLSAFHYAGFDVPLDGYTETMVTQFPNAGFENITSQINLSTGEGLIRGDVLLNHATHTAIYIGNGQMVDARIDEVGETQGSQMGDQTGEEIMVHNYNNHPWTHVFRYSK